MAKKKIIQQSPSIEDNETQTPIEDEEEHNRTMKKKKKRDKVKTKIEENTDTEMGETTHSNTRSVLDKPLNKMDEIAFKIETVRENPDKISPFVGYFPSGFNPSIEGDTRQSQPRVGVFRNAKRSNRLQLVVSPNSCEVDFVGTNYTGEATAAQVCTYALGILDKATNTLKMVPIAANKIFRLEPRVAHAEFTDNETSEIVKEELTQQEKADKIKDLTLRYSTKKTIRQVKKKESLHQKQDAKSQEYLDKKLEEQEINQEGLEVAAATITSEARNIPPYDMSATTPQKAYPLDKIILKGEWDYLSDIFELSQGGAEVKPDLYPSFVCNRVYKLDHIKDEGMKQRLACIFSYITHLVKFKDKHSMDGFSSAKYHKLPSILSLKFSDMYADSDSKRLSDEKRDLLISYILVLTLFADDFKTDPSDIAKDLRMSAVKLRPHFEHLGCKLVREGNVSVVKLSVPLKFPTLRKRRRRGQ